MKLKNLLLKNHWANFNQTWHKTFLGDEDSSLFKLRAQLFSKGRYSYYEKAKMHNDCWNLNIFFPRITWPIATKFATKHPLVKGIQVCSKEEPFNSHKIDNEFFLLLINIMIIICSVFIKKTIVTFIVPCTLIGMPFFISCLRFHFFLHSTNACMKHHSFDCNKVNFNFSLVF